MSNQAEEKFAELCSLNQLDLGSLDRDRVNAVCQGLLSGLSTIFDALREETEQAQVLRQQQEIISAQNTALQAANVAMLGTEYRELLIAFVETYPTNPGIVETGLYRAYKLLERSGVELAAETTTFWENWLETRNGKEEKENEEEADPS